ncbi:MAG: ATP-dependent helicase, partial [Chloroflexi bacterium]|nr:ATP-dependent helicase [Chloroflexota bacterium]
PGQQQALNAAPDTTLAIIAGAGTGKTETLARRYVTLLTHDAHLHPRNIVVLTFTEKAATEMRARIMYTVTNQGLPFNRIDMAEAQISTFHAFAARLALQRSIALNLNPDEPFCEELERDDIGQACWERFLDNGWHDAIVHLSTYIDEYDWNDDTLFTQINQMIADAKGLGYTREALFATIAKTNRLSPKHELYGQLLAWNFVARAQELSQRGQLDLDDLIQIVPIIKSQFPELLAHIRYVMVDEYQDTSSAQADLLDSITPRPHGRTAARTVVGDPRQAIYVWRQANVQNIVQMKEISDVCVNLTENRRSLAPILAVANRSLMTYRFGNPTEYDASAQLHPPTPTAPAPADCVRLWQMSNRLQEADAVATRMRDLHMHQQIPYGDMAILLRQRTHLDLYADAMHRAGIPFDRGKNDPFYHRTLILDAIHLLNACYDPANEQSLARALLSATRTCDDVSLRAIRQQRRDASLWQLLGAHGENYPRIQEFVNNLIAVQRKQWEFAPAEWFAATLEQFGLWQRDGAYGQRMLTKLINDCRALQSGSSRELLRELLERIRYEPDSASPELKTNANAVQIMTVHAAKGLEFTAVFVPDAHAFDTRTNKHMTFQSGVLVDPQSDESTQAQAVVELERQKYNEMVALWYVALTRAKCYLMVSAVGLEKNSLFTAMYESLQDAPIAGVDCTLVHTTDATVATLPLPTPEQHTHTVTRIASKQIITLSPSALHELVQCPQRFRYQRRSGLDHLLDHAEDVAPMYWTDAPSIGHYTLPQLQDAWTGIHVEPTQLEAADDPYTAGQNARAIGSLFHLAAESHAYHPQATAQQLTEVAVQRYAKAVDHQTKRLLTEMLTTYLASPVGQSVPRVQEVEQRMRWRVETPHALIEMSGVIDRHWNNMIIDYKTDETTDGIVERHGDQLRLYAQAWMRLQKQTQIPNIAVYHTRSGTLHQIPNDERAMRQTQQLLADGAAMIVQREYPARPAYTFCRHCPARPICPDGKSVVPPQEIPLYEPFDW